MTNNIIQDKSFRFAVEIIDVYKKLALKEKEFVLSKQLLRSGTSIGANIEEALGGQSRKDFQSKISIAYKETRETMYWLKLLAQSGYLDKEQFTGLLELCEELARILGSTKKTLEKK